MKKKILLLFLVFTTVNVFNQETIKDFLDVVDGIYASIDPESVPTNILFDQGFRNIDNFIAQEQVQSDYYNYWAFYTNLQRCKHGSPEEKVLPAFNSLVNWEDYNDNLHRNIPLSYIFYKGNYLGAEETLNFFEDKDYSPTISEKGVFALSAMVPDIYRPAVTFELNSELIFSNASNDVNKLEIDFGDGSGFRTIDFNSDLISINYDCIGEKSIVAKLYTSHDTLTANSMITVKADNISEASISGTVKSSTQKSTGEIVGGKFRCELGNDNVLDKPILIVEGFDLMNANSENKKYAKWESTLKELQANGYDVYCLNFDDAKLSLFENKEVVKAMITKINEDKTGNHEGIIIGESMGGVLTRMALKEMEDDNIDHQIGLYVSFDSPHKGANIPPGIQLGVKDAIGVFSDVSEVIVPFLKIFNDIFGDYISHELIDETINSMAAQQLLSRHSLGSIEFDALQVELKNLGFPENSRNVALLNGNNRGENVPFSPGDRIFNHQWNWAIIAGHYHELTLNSTAVNTTQQLVSQVTLVSLAIPDLDWYDVLAGIPPTPSPTFVHKKRYYTSDDKAYDNCPGGLQKVSLIDLDVEGFSFIPVSSGIDLNDDIFNSATGLHQLTSANTKDDIINNNQTPFDDIYASSINTKHVRIQYWTPNDNPLIKLMDHEIMHDDLYIQNRTIDKDRDFEATNNIKVGNNVDHQTGKNIKAGDVSFGPGNTVNLSAPLIILDPGTIIENGCALIAEATSSNIPSLKTAKPSSPKTPFIPDISRKMIANNICCYLDNVSENELSFISWSIYSHNYKYQSSELEFIIPEDLPDGQYMVRADLRSKGNSFQSITRVLNISGKSANNQLHPYSNKGLGDPFIIKTFPNPTNGLLHISQPNSESTFRVFLYDLKGNIILEKEIKGQGTIDMSNYMGFYFLKVIQNGETVLRKIIAQ